MIVTPTTNCHKTKIKYKKVVTHAVIDKYPGVILLLPTQENIEINLTNHCL